MAHVFECVCVCVRKYILNDMHVFVPVSVTGFSSVYSLKRLVFSVPAPFQAAGQFGSCWIDCKRSHLKRHLLQLCALCEIDEVASPNVFSTLFIHVKALR